MKPKSLDQRVFLEQNLKDYGKMIFLYIVFYMRVDLIK